MKKSLFIIYSILFIIFAAAPVSVNAQPTKRRAVPDKTTTTSKTATTRDKQISTVGGDRAALSFPASADMPEEVVWRRDIYRQLDLTKDANAPLYYPVEPRGKEQNLFTYIFRLMLSGRIPVYEYKIDGNESFEEDDRVKPAQMDELLDRYHINYEGNGSRITVLPVDIPSRQVKRFDVKETCYYDQRSATYKRRVTALCPVLMDEFSTGDIPGDDEMTSQATSYPLFWVKYDDVAPYLSRMPLMASNLNNVTNMTVDDFFTLNRYDGKIYKTNNLQGRVLANYCKSDSAMTQEQERIEKELEDFENHIWRAAIDADAPAGDEPVAPETVAAAVADSTAAPATAAPAAKKQPRAAAKKNSSNADNKSRRSRSASAAAKPPRSSSAPKASARRQRR